MVRHPFDFSSSIPLLCRPLRLRSKRLDFSLRPPRLRFVTIPPEGLAKISDNCSRCVQGSFQNLRSVAPALSELRPEPWADMKPGRGGLSLPKTPSEPIASLGTAMPDSIGDEVRR